MITRFRLSVLLMMVVVLAGCATAGGQGSDRDSDRITRAEIDQLSSVGTLYDVVHQLRPRWLNVRGSRSMAGSSTSVVVFQGNSLLGGIDVLRQFGPEAVYAIQYLDGATASASLPGLGSRHVEGAIVLETSPQG